MHPNGIVSPKGTNVAAGSQPPAGIPALLAEALRGAGDVLRGEIALFRQEIGDNLRSLVIGFVMVVAAAVFGIVGMLVLVTALVKWLATVVGSEALSALIVGGAFLLIAVVLGLVGKGRMSVSTLAPTRTGRQLRKDAHVVAEQVKA